MVQYRKIDGGFEVLINGIAKYAFRYKLSKSSDRVYVKGRPNYLNMTQSEYNGCWYEENQRI